MSPPTEGTAETTGAAPAVGVRATRWRWTIAGAVGVLVVAVCTFLVRDGVVSSFERGVFRAFNELPDELEPPMVVIQYAGVAVIPFVVALVALVRRQWYLVVAALLVYPLKLAVEKALLKEIVYRARPGVTVPDAVLRHAPAAGPSFPSGHAIIAFAVAGILAPYLGRGWRAVAWTVAAGVTISRMYLGAHNPLDVVAGAAAGVVLAAILNLVFAPGFGLLPAHRR